MNSKKVLFKNLASLGLIQIANFIMPLISVPIISRIIGPEKFGLINYAGAFLVYFNLFIGYGFNLTAIRKISINPSNTSLRNKVFSEVFYCQIILFILSTIIYFILVFTIPALSSDKKLAVFTFLFCISSVLTQNWFLQAMQDLSKVTVLNLLGKIIYLIGVLSFIKTKEDYHLQPLTLSVTQIVVSILSFNWVIKKYDIHFVKIKFKECIKILWNEKTIFFTIMFGSLYTSANIIFLGLLQSQEQVGYYTAGQRLISVAQLVVTIPLAQVFFPFIGRAFGESREKGIQAAQKLLPIVITFCCILTISIWILGAPVLHMFYGSAFSPAIPVFKILAIIPLLIATSNIFGIQIMLNLKMDKIHFKLTAACAAVSIVLNLLLASKWGYIGSAINWLLTEILICTVLYIVLLKNNIQPINFQYFTPKYLIFLFLNKTKKLV